MVKELGRTAATMVYRFLELLNLVHVRASIAALQKSGSNTSLFSTALREFSSSDKRCISLCGPVRRTVAGTSGSYVRINHTHPSICSRSPRRLARQEMPVPKNILTWGKTRRIAHLLLLPVCKIASTDVALVTNQLCDSTDTHTANRPGWTCYHRYDRGRLAQLVRAPALQAGCRGFESLTAHHPSSHPPGQLSCCCCSRDVWPEIVLRSTRDANNEKLFIQAALGKSLGSHIPQTVKR
jgi:hypothetical protein